MSSSSSWRVAICLLVVTSLYTRLPASTGNANSQLMLHEFPSAVGQWRCEPVPLEQGDYTDPYVNAAWAGRCGRDGGSEMTVYIGYAAVQKGEKKILSPRIHYPKYGGNWSYVSSRAIRIPSGDGATPFLEANETVLRHPGGERSAILYWYQKGDRTFSDEYRHRLYLLLRNLLRNTTDTAVVRISSQIKDGGDEKVFREEMMLGRELYQVMAERFDAFQGS